MTSIRSPRQDAARAAQGELAAEAYCLCAAGEVGEDVSDECDDLDCSADDGTEV